MIVPFSHGVFIYHKRGFSPGMIGDVQAEGGHIRTYDPRVSKGKHSAGRENHQTCSKLVGGDWNMTFIFPYIVNDQPN